jgi:hypothetical protein
MRVLLALGVALVLSGCASSLKVADGAGRPAPGVPFRIAEVYLASGTYTRHTEDGDACVHAVFERQISLPTGALYFANVEPALLAKTEFSMTFNESGTLASITMNTEPKAAEAITAVSDALVNLLPLAGVGPGEGVSGASPGGTEAGEPPNTPATKKACDTGPTDVTYSLFRAS